MNSLVTAKTGKVRDHLRRGRAAMLILKSEVADKSV